MVSTSSVDGEDCRLRENINSPLFGSSYFSSILRQMQILTGLTGAVLQTRKQQDALGAYTCASAWIKCESFWFYWVLTVYTRLGFSVLCQIAEYSRCPVYQVLHQLAEDLDTNKKKTRGKPKLVPRFAVGTSNEGLFKRDSSNKYYY